MESPEALLYNSSVMDTYAELPQIKEYQPFQGGAELFHEFNQLQWLMPKEYKEMDIAKWVLDQCKTQEELQRVGEELLLYQERNLFPLLSEIFQ